MVSGIVAKGRIEVFENGLAKVELDNGRVMAMPLDRDHEPGDHVEIIQMREDDEDFASHTVVVRGLNKTTHIMAQQSDDGYSILRSATFIPANRVN